MADQRLREDFEQQCVWHLDVQSVVLLQWWLSLSGYLYIYIYIYAFSRRFYPKRLTIAFRLYIFISTCVPWESNPQPFALLTQCSITEPHRNTILILYQNYLSIYVSLVSGVYDNQLQWPCPWRQITFQMLDQNPHIQKRMSSEKSFTMDPAFIYSSENLIIFLSYHVYKQHCSKLKIKVIITCSFERTKSHILL